MYSQITYVADGSATVYTVPFGYINQTDVSVTVGGAATPFVWQGEQSIILSAAPEAGQNIIVSRTTDITLPLVNFVEASTLQETDLDGAVQQVLFGLQEVRDSQTALQTFVTSLTLSAGNLPPPTEYYQFLVSTTDSWAVVDLGTVKTILGLDDSGAAGVPDPGTTAGQFLISNDHHGYDLKSASDARSAIGVGTSATLNRPTTLGYDDDTNLGTAAFYNIGNATAGDDFIPLNKYLGPAARKYTTVTDLHSGRLVETIDIGGGTIGLPAIDGSQLTGIFKGGKYAKFEERHSATVDGGIYPGGWVARQITTEVADGIGIGVATDGTLTLPAGNYRFTARSKCVGIGVATLRLAGISTSLVSRGISVKTNSIDGIVKADAPAESEVQVSGSFTVAADGTTYQLQIFGTVTQASTDWALGISHDIAGTVNIYAVLELWRVD
jgi:hypothetical protein